MFTFPKTPLLNSLQASSTAMKLPFDLTIFQSPLFLLYSNFLELKSFYNPYIMISMEILF